VNTARTRGSGSLPLARARGLCAGLGRRATRGPVRSAGPPGAEALRESRSTAFRLGQVVDWKLEHHRDDEPRRT